MRTFLLIFSVFAFLAAQAGGIAHAGLTCDPATENCAAAHEEAKDVSDNGAADDCAGVCGSCHAHCHHHAAPSFHNDFAVGYARGEKRAPGKEIICLSDFVYGLKRPPRA